MPKWIGNRIGIAITEGATKSANFNTFDQYYFSKLNNWIAPFSASGGTVLTPGNGFQYHVFISPGNFVVASGTKNIDVLLVGGGGGSSITDGRNGSGGAGGGGANYSPGVTVTAAT